MKVMAMPIVIGTLGTVTEGLLKELEDLETRGRVKTIQATALLRSARILRRDLETWGDLSLRRLCEKPSRSKNDNNPIYQPLRSGRIWHKVNF